MSYQVSFLWKNNPRFESVHYLFDTASMAEAYADNREAKCNDILDSKINSRPQKATHIFADGKVHTIHDNAEAWKTILEGEHINGNGKSTTVS